VGGGGCMGRRRQSPACDRLLEVLYSSACRINWQSSRSLPADVAAQAIQQDTAIWMPLIAAALNSPWQGAS